MQFEAFLLDVDGTLVDSNDAHAHAWVETLAAHGHDVAFDRVRRLIGMGGDRLVEELTGLARDSEQNQAIGTHRSQLFLDRWLRHVRPLPGARRLVLRLRDRNARYAIASAARSDELRPLLEIADIADLVTIQTTSSEVDESKPDPEIVQTALGKLGVAPERAVMVGDTPYDLEAASRAGIAAIALTSGGWRAADLHSAVAIYATPGDLADAL